MEGLRLKGLERAIDGFGGAGNVTAHAFGGFASGQGQQGGKDQGCSGHLGLLFV